MIDYSRYQTIKVEKADKVAILTLNRPQNLNAFDALLHRELEDVLEDVAKDEEVNVVILTGAGRAFSSGGDIKMMEERLKDPSVPRVPIEGARRLILNILNLEKPIIAAVNGHAVGLGATVALFCDIIIAAEDARRGDAHVRVGRVAGDGGAVIWPLLVGVAKAKEMLLTGDLITAAEAERMGLINKVVPREEVMPTALALARRLANGPTKAIRWTKSCLNKRVKDEVNLVLDTSLSLEWLSMGSEDHKEAVRAFLEKREPQFKGE